MIKIKKYSDSPCIRQTETGAKIIFHSMLLIFIIGRSAGHAQTMDMHGQGSAWGMINAQHISQIGLRYIPDLFIEKPVTGNWTLDTEISWQGVQWWQFDHDEYQTDSNKLKPYRLWLRLAGSQFEARIGLQKINFGSARMIRPLMWFDKLDPRDPLQLTDGVYGLLLKYTFLNNANVWIWGLYGNDDPKGFEIFGTKKNTPEYGGRIQYPVQSGEIALTVHHRNVELIESPENRFALDGRWDMMVGFWFEIAMTHMEWELMPYNYQKTGTLGLDYTFNLGNGLYCQAEHFMLQVSKKWTGPGSTIKLTAFSANYSLGLIDNLYTVIYHDWDQNDWYRFIDWQRTYDRWQFYVIGFWNPDNFQLIQFQTNQSLFTGKGVQIMVVFNH